MVVCRSKGMHAWVRQELGGRGGVQQGRHQWYGLGQVPPAQPRPFHQRPPCCAHTFIQAIPMFKYSQA